MSRGFKMELEGHKEGGLYTCPIEWSPGILNWANPQILQELCKNAYKLSQ